MKKRVFLFSVLYLLNQAVFASTITSVICGNWTSPTTWDLNRIPLSSDTIVVNSFVSFDADFVSQTPGMLNVTICGTLCGAHNYTGHFLFNGIVYMNELTITYGHSISNSVINIQQMISLTGTGTSYDVSNGSVCVGCSSLCQNCSTNNKQDKINCAQNGIAALTNSNTLYFYPNPAADQLNVNGIINKTSIKVFDLFGKLVLDIETEVNTTINTSQLANGIYSVIAKDDRGKIYNKIVIANN